MWCRAEQFCYAVRNGAQGIWLATSVDSVVKVDVHWLNTGLMVFEGELTCCSLKHVFHGVEQCESHALYETKRPYE